MATPDSHPVPNDIAAFDPRDLSQDFLDNPYPTYHRLRQFDPVHTCPDGSYFLTRYADVVQCYRDRRMSSDKTLDFKPKFGDGPLYQHHTTSLVFNDPPLHTRVRSLLAAAFTPRALSALEPRIVTLVDGLVAEAAEKETFDLIADFAFALPVEVICDMLGVPRGDRAPFRNWSLAILGALEPVISDAVLQRGNQAVHDFRSYLVDLVAERRRQPGSDSDVLSALIRGDADGNKLSDEELYQNCIFLLNAGHETTTNLIGNAIAALLAHPDEFQQLRQAPDLMPQAIEEFLRFDSSNQLGNRRLTADMKLDGHSLPAGAAITMCIGGANRDPAVFPDPDRLNITRKPNRHLAFATGPHVCMGATLARLEGRIAIGTLLRTFRRIEPAGKPVRGGRARFRGFQKFPLRVEKG